MALPSSTLMSFNGISVVQDQPESIDLLRARNRVYGRAKIRQGSYVLATILIGLLGSIVSVDHKPIFGLFGIFALLFDVLFLESHIKGLCRLGAQLGEDFDIKVLELPRNQFVCGPSVIPEDVRKYSEHLLDADRERKLLRWYEPQVNQVPLPIGRLICQRTNISYDSRLRGKYAARMMLFVLPVLCTALLLCLLMEIKLAATVTLFSSLLPVLNWFARDLRKHLDAKQRLEKLRDEFDRLWGQALDGLGDEELLSGSRRLQDAIFQHRANTNLISDWFYQRMRPKSEDEAGAAANRLIQELRAAHG